MYEGIIMKYVKMTLVVTIPDNQPDGTDASAQGVADFAQALLDDGTYLVSGWTFEVSGPEESWS